MPSQDTFMTQRNTHTHTHFVLFHFSHVGDTFVHSDFERHDQAPMRLRPHVNKILAYSPKLPGATATNNYQGRAVESARRGV